MTRKDGQIVNLVAGWLCLGSAALNWWNMFGVGFTVWRIPPAIALTFIGLFLLYRSRQENGRAVDMQG